MIHAKKMPFPAVREQSYLSDRKNMCRQVPGAQGRYILSHEYSASTTDISDVLSERFPQYKFPAGEDTPSQKTVDTSKVSLFLFLCFYLRNQDWPWFTAALRSDHLAEMRRFMTSYGRADITRKLFLGDARLLSVLQQKYW